LIRTFAPLLLVICLGCAGCHGIATVTPPVTTVRGVRLVRQTQEAARFEATLELRNPNNVPLPMRKSHYTLVVENAGRARLDDLPNRTIPARGVQTVVLPAAISTRRGVAGGRYHLDGSVTYDPPGNLRRFLTDSGIPLPEVLFARAGTLE
jgi:LEA14-like dessication related protein